jgi:hypothetical protein
MTLISHLITLNRETWVEQHFTVQKLPFSSKIEAIAEVVPPFFRVNLVKYFKNNAFTM